MPHRALSAAAAAPTSFLDRFEAAADLRGFVERHRGALDDPQTAYFVSQALEECAALRPLVARRDDDEPSDGGMELAALALLTEPCRSFAGVTIEPREILALLESAALRGEPRAIARMLLFRDIAAEKLEALPELPRLLATRDPVVVRDVGAFLSRGEAVWRYGRDEVAASTAAIAWELAACDFGYACGPASRLALAHCAFDGRCAAGRYEDALAQLEPPERMAQAQRLRAGIVRALQAHDWQWLGLG